MLPQRLLTRSWRDTLPLSVSPYDLEVTAMKKRSITYFGHCMCGWHSRRRIDPDAAIQYGEEHLARVGGADGADGRRHCTFLDRA